MLASKTTEISQEDFGECRHSFWRRCRFRLQTPKPRPDQYSLNTLKYSNWHKNVPTGEGKHVNKVCGPVDLLSSFGKTQLADTFFFQEHPRKGYYFLATAWGGLIQAAEETGHRFSIVGREFY